VTLGNGDWVRGAEYQGKVDDNDPDHRDATFVRVSGHYISHPLRHLTTVNIQYSLLRDVHEKHPHRPSVFEATKYFGQLISTLVVELLPGIIPSIPQSKTLVLAIIGTRNTMLETPLKIPYYTEPREATVSAVDINTLMCLVGRIKDRGRWAIIDRSGDLARAEFVD